MTNYVAVARGHDLVVIRVMGRGNMLNAPALQEFAEEQRKAGYTHFLFDFERCSGLDSTFMGVMVGMQSVSDSGHHAAVTVPALVGIELPKNEGSPDETAELEPMSPEEALAALSRQGIGAQKKEPRMTTVSAVNVPKEILALLAMLGVDKFVKLRGTCDLSKLEMTILPEKAISPLERQELILKAHEQLVEIDQRNAAQFGDLLKSLAEEMGKK
ncbi:MAG TPA: STAS domain-containing protein [Planctomycetota bacterium]|nr:STAS domain-containing protein [Planctomycetota bacterium]